MDLKVYTRCIFCSGWIDDLMWKGSSPIPQKSWPCNSSQWMKEELLLHASIFHNKFTTWSPELHGHHSPTCHPRYISIRKLVAIAWNLCLYSCFSVVAFNTSCHSSLCQTIIWPKPLFVRLAVCYLLPVKKSSYCNHSSFVLVVICLCTCLQLYLGIHASSLNYKHCNFKLDGIIALECDSKKKGINHIHLTCLKHISLV